MQLDPIIQYFALISTILLVTETAVLFFLAKLYISSKNKKIIYETSIIRDPIAPGKEVGTKQILRRAVWYPLSVSAICVYLQYMVNSSYSSPELVSIIKFTFGIIAFSSIQKIIAGLTMRYQLTHASDDYIKGEIFFSRKYTIQQASFTFLCYAIALGFFALLTHSAYLFGGTTIYLVFALRDWLILRRLMKKQAK